MRNLPIISLRHATLQDLPILEYWDLQPEIIESDPNDNWNWEYELTRSPEWREQLIAELQGVPIGFVQIIDPAKEESHYWGNVLNNLRAIDIWIGEKQNHGKGYGSVMMKLSLDRCFNNNEVTAVLVDPLESNVRAHSFYRRLGFEFLEKRKFGDDHCLVFQFDRKSWQRVQADL